MGIGKPLKQLSSGINVALLCFKLSHEIKKLQGSKYDWRNQTHAQCFWKRHKTYTEDNGKSTFPLPQTTDRLQRKLFPSTALHLCLPEHSTSFSLPALGANALNQHSAASQRLQLRSHTCRSQQLEKPPRGVLGDSSFPSAHIIPPLAEATVEFFPANLALNHPSRPSDSRFIFLGLC